MVGSLGDIIFEVSSSVLRTIDQYRRSGSVRYGTHQRMIEKPITEFLGKDLDKISFTMRFSRQMGVTPEREMEALIDYMNNGEVLVLMLNNKVIGDNKWVIESLSESVKSFNSRGAVLVSEVNVSLLEYVERM